MNMKTSAMQKIVERMSARANDSRHVSALLGTARGLVAATEAVAGLHAVAANDKRVAEAARRLAAKVDAVVRELNDHARAGVMELDGAILQKSRLTQTPFAAEIRSVYRSLTPDAAQAFLMKAVESGDAETIAALCCVPHSVTMLDPAQAARLRQFHEERCAPEESRQRADLMDSLTEALLIADLAREECTQLLSPEAQRAEAAAQRAEEAAARVAQTVGT